MEEHRSEHNTHFVEFSLFEGDLFNRFFAAIGLPVTTVPLLIGRAIFFIFVTWIPLTILAFVGGVEYGRVKGENFSLDVAAIGQFLLCLPMFVFAEMELSRRTRNAGRGLFYSGVIIDDDRAALLELHRKMITLRRRWLPDFFCAVLGYLFTYFWIHAELHNGRGTWHALLDTRNHQETLTAAGWWEIVVAVPLLNYCWLRWIWKILLWCRYLFKASRLRMNLVAMHPDQTGGLGFLSKAQAGFALAIFAFGLGTVGASVGYKLSIENATLDTFAVWGPLFGFIIGAPIFFMLPLLFFTKQLLRTKRRAVLLYEEQAMDASRQFEETWLQGGFKNQRELFSSHVSAQNNIFTLGERLDDMRVIPFDLRSFSQLLGSASSPLLFLLPHIFDLPEPALKVIEIAKKVIGGG